MPQMSTEREQQDIGSHCKRGHRLVAVRTARQKFVARYLSCVVIHGKWAKGRDEERTPK